MTTAGNPRRFTRTLRALKLGGLKDTLPERLALARQRKMGHAAFLELVLSDEVARRESRSEMLRARAAGLDPTMRLDTWDEPEDLTYDRMLLSDLTSLRFTEAGHGVLVLGPVGVGETHLATALGHIGIRRRLSVVASRTDKLFTRLRAARLDNTLEAEMRKLARVDLLILDDFALRNLDATETNDFYELIVERHHKDSTIVTSNREPAEWMSMMSDALLAQSAIDRLTSGAHTLVIEGPSYRQRTRPGNHRDIPWGDDNVTTTTCPVCGTGFTPIRRQRFCRPACRQTAYRRAHQDAGTPQVTVSVPVIRPRKETTIYQCWP